MDKDKHVIYKITNTINGKIYIGQTKQYYGKTKYGIHRRFQKHIYDATKNEGKGCPYLCNAIRKYGKENFVVELLEKTTEDLIDEKEEYYIKKYNSTNTNIGYNIALGGKGRKVVFVSEEARYNISKSQNKNKEEKRETSIQPYKDKKTGEIIGYRARRKNKKDDHEKYFTSKKNTPEENYELAKQFINDVKDNKHDKYNKYNKINDLPKNISYVYSKSDKQKIVGYQVSIMKNGKKLHKSFQSLDKQLDELLQEAIQYKQEILEQRDTQ